MNKVFLIGRLTQDPVASTTNGGISYCRFSIAVNRNFSRDGENKVDFINIVTWDKLAGNCVKYLEKGSQVAVTGSINTDSYEKDGQKRQSFSIRADQVEFLSRANGGSQGQASGNSSRTEELTPADDDDMPF